MMKQIIKHVKQEKHLHAASSTENSEENASRHGWPGGQKFSG